MTRSVTAIVLILGLAAACGSDSAGTGQPGAPSPSTAAPPTVASSPPPTTAPEPTAPPDPGEVVDADAGVRAELARVAGTDEDGPFYMVNLLDFHDDLADYPADSPWAGSTAAEADARYAAVVQPALEAVGATAVFVADVERTLIAGGDDIAWDRIGVVRYPSRAALLEMSSDPEFAAGVVHKDASLAHTFALVTERIDLPPLPDADPAALPFPSTDADPAMVVFHVIDFHDEAAYPPGEEPDDAPISGREAVDRYTQNAGSVAGPLGVRPRGWFEVHGALLGPHQRFEQVRLNEFPSRAAFAALTSDPKWAAGQVHRQAGIAETYALSTRPILFDRSFGGDG